MGQLTNLYVSESYQGLLKLTDSTTGLTSTLQTVQDGLGGNSPLQISRTQVNISGSLTINGSPITGSNVDTGSFVTTSSFNAYTSSIDTRIDGIEAKTGSYATTGSNTFIGSQIIEGNVSFPSNSFVSSDNVSGALYISSLNQGTLYINADGGEGNVNIGHNGWTGKLNVTGSLGVTNIQGTGSLFLQPNQSDARLVEIYNTSPTDTHITASGGQIFLGDDQTYVKVDNYGSVERIDIVAGNELVVSSSVTNLTGSLHQSGTFYPDQVDWINSSIQLGTGSYILTTDVSGVTQYDTYQNVASALQPFINTGSINRNGLITTGSIGGSQSITGSLNVQGTITATSASFTYVNTVYETASVIYSSGSNQFGDASNDTQTLWGTVNLPSGPLVITGSVTSTGGFTGSLQGTASFAQTASVALNGGVTQLLAGPNITLSPISGIGQVTISSSGAGTGSFNTATGSYGSFYDTTIQTNPVANTPNSMSFNNTAITNGVSISGSISPFNTYIKTVNAGTYNIQFSAQVDKTDSGSDDIDIWIRKNGIDLVDTGTKLTLPSNNSKVVAAWNWFVQSAANDYYQLIWSSADTNMRLFAEPSSSLHPGIPSVIATANRVDQFLSNTGSFTGSFIGSFTGSLQGTASYATQALSASYAPDTTDTGSFMTTGSVAGNVLTFTKGNGTTFNLTVNTGSAIDTGSFATTGSNIFRGSQVLSGSLIGNVLNDGMIYINSEAYNSGSVKASISASAAISQSNIFFGNPTGPAAANQTGSIVISGSNNIFMGGPRPNTISQGTYGYVNGTLNILAGTQTLNTASVYRPQTSNNFNNSSLVLAFTSGALSAPVITTNGLYSPVTINHQSASMTYNQNINVGQVTSTANNINLPFLTTFQGNIFGASTNTINHISSSVTMTNNLTNGASLTVTNLVSSSVSATANGLSVNNNIIGGNGVGLWVSGSNPTNRRTITGNLLGGGSTSVTASAVGSEFSSLQNSVVWGQNLIVSGTHPANSNGGSTFLGRFNDATTLHTSNEIVFAVGTGTGTGTRRTGLWIDSGSNVVTSGSFRSIGNAQVTGSLTLSGSAGPELIVIGDALITGSLGVTGSVFVTGSVQGNVNNLTVASNTASLNLNDGNFFVLQLTGSIDTHINPSNIKAGQTVNIKLNTTGSGTVSFPSSVKQVSGSAYVPSTGTTTDIITLVSFDSSNLFLANVKNLI